MKGDHIYYKSGYKYQLTRTYGTYIKVFPEENITTDYILLNRDGFLTIMKGYAWDGPSGPTYDSKDSMRGSLVHDALYQLMRLGLLKEEWRSAADDELHNICVEDGMWHWRAELWEEAVSLFAGGYARYGSEQEEQVAP